MDQPRNPLLDPTIASSRLEQRDCDSLGSEILASLSDPFCHRWREFFGDDAMRVCLGIVDQKPFDLETSQSTALGVQPSGE